MKNFDELCPNCMKCSENSEICKFCGEEKNLPQKQPFLPKKIMICERYLVGKGIEINGESLSYVMYDTVSERKVYVKEFFPEGLCERSDDFLTVKPIEYQKKDFLTEKEKFYKYFKSLTNFRNLNTLISVYDIIKSNGTYYVVLEWAKGMRLDKFLSKQPNNRLSWDDTQKIFQPLMNALSKLHDSAIFHLGINPENIFINDDKKLKLSGFATNSIRIKNSYLNAKLYDGTSAIEQYLDIYECDESTDIYGLCATIFFCLTGEYPPSAPKRKKDESILMDENILKEIPENVITALVNGLKVYPNNRTLSISNLKSDLFGDIKSKIAMIENSLSLNMNKKNKFFKDKNFPKKQKDSGFTEGMIACILTLSALILCLAGYWFFFKNNKNPINNETTNESHNLIQPEDTNNILENPLEKIKIPAPKLINLKYKDVKNSLNDNSEYNVLLISEEFSDIIDEGKIISQSPAENEEISSGDTIAVTVSKGSKNKILPEISKNSISEASQKLTKLHLNPISESEWSDDIEEGLVIDYKNNSAGEIVEYGSDITFLISRGKK